MSYFELQQREYQMRGAYHFSDLTLSTADGIEATAKLALTIDTIMKTNPHRVADLGCGEGVLVQTLRPKGINCIGLDLSKQALDLVPPGIKGLIVQADLGQLPLQDSSIDSAAMIAVLEHISPPQIQTVLKEATRIIRKSGRLIVRVPSTNQSLEPKHYQHFTENSLRHTLSSAGFVVEEVLGNHDTEFEWGKYYSELGRLSDNMKYRAYQQALMICNPAKAKRLLAVCLNI